LIKTTIFYFHFVSYIFYLKYKIQYFFNQDLYNKFEEAEGENCSRTTSSFVIDLSQDTTEVNDNVSGDKKDGDAGSKRAFPFEGDENGTPGSLVLKKVIKVEKE
jgi:hypothetical protein